ncbi:hypothetical protein LVJ85_07755 [Neisseria sp. Dent CA1/247]|uniref:hypothetical protein n=1 Tax=Neisseria TaxID=482 RepID=UPI000D2FFE32|nr:MULTISPECIES: hypothetical protein [Neisseria]UOO75943.1 hypothetical protein LVJ85_07755 [Neisseria sp. Dent CA1/247]
MSIYQEGLNFDRTVDFFISFDEETEEYVVDIFNAQISDKDQAYIETFECEDFEEALELAQNYKLLMAA